jgi:PAS domain S-box-containing protein
MNVPRILVVDDTPDLLMLFSEVLGQAGYGVLQAPNATECLRIVKEELPDLVLLDVMLPDLSGIEVCKRIKSDQETAEVFVIHVSGMRTSADSAAEGLEAGADGYLVKPIEPRALVAHVNALLRLKQTEHALKQSEEQFKTAFDNALDGLLITDDQANYLDANPAACELFGVARGEMLRRNLSDFVEPAERRAIENAWRTFIEKGEQRGNFHLYRPDGTTRELEYRAKANFLPNRHLSIVRDVTERKKAEVALQEAHDELERRVEQRTAELLASNAFLKDEIAERKRAEEALAERLRFETLLTELSAAFTNLTSDRVDQAIDDWLKRLVEFFGIDRATFSKFEENGKKLYRRHSYTSGSVRPLTINAIHERLPWMTEQLSQGHVFRWSRIPDNLPQAANKDREYFASMRIKSSLSIPVAIGGEVVSVLGLTSVRSTREWPDELVIRLRLVGEIFANAFMRTHTQQALTESEERFHLLVEGVTDYAIFMLDNAGHIVSWNEGIRRIKGYDQGEILGKHFSCFYTAEDRKDQKPERELATAAREGYMEDEGWRVRKDGSLFWAKATITALRDKGGNLRGFLKVTRDITERKLAEQALQEAEANYRGIFENAIEGIFQSTPEGQFLSANPAMGRMFGYDSAEELIAARKDLEHQHYVDPARRRTFRELIDREGIVQHFELQAYRKDGSKIWTSESVRAVSDSDGTLLYYEGIVEDITERKRLEETHQLLSSIVESSRDAIVSFTVDGKIMSWNTGAEEMFGYSGTEAKGHDISSFLPPGVARESLPLFEVVKKGESVNFEAVRIGKDGKPIDVSIINSPIRNELGEIVGVSGIVRDISDRKRAEKLRNQLMRRLVTTQEEERRRLSRELHDQTGQALAALMLGLKSLESSGQFESSARERLQGLQELTSKLAQEVHTLARDLRPTALDDFGLQTALSNYVEEWSERTQIAADFHSNGLIKERLPPQVETTVYRIVQEALTNVLKHAQARNVSIIVEHRGNRVMAIIEDNGCGFDAEAMMNKPMSERRLGLLGMKERVSLLGGDLDIESTPKAGTTVLVHIPI